METTYRVLRIDEQLYGWRSCPPVSRCCAM